MEPSGLGDEVAILLPLGDADLSFALRDTVLIGDQIDREPTLAAGMREDRPRRTIAPGIVDTQMTQQAATNELTKAAFEQIPIPIKRWGKPEEMAEPIAFLLSPAASYIVGQTIFADGGIDALLQPTAHPHPLPPMN